MTPPSRRKFLVLSSGIAATTVLPSTVRAQMVRTPLNNMPEAIKRITGGAPVTRGRVTLDIPPLVENGFLVPMSVSVDSPMTEQSYVAEVAVLVPPHFAVGAVRVMR